MVTQRLGFHFLHIIAVSTRVTFPGSAPNPDAKEIHHKMKRTFAVLALASSLSLAAVGFAQDKMSDSKMSDSKMSDSKTKKKAKKSKKSDGKMSDSKMSDSKMSDSKM